MVSCKERVNCCLQNAVKKGWSPGSKNIRIDIMLMIPVFSKEPHPKKNLSTNESEEFLLDVFQ